MDHRTAINRPRFELIDALRGVAALSIVVHHLVSYGVLSDLVYERFPDAIGWLFEYGRMAVQVFFVISGFVTAYTVSPAGFSVGDFARFSARRYIRLGFPYIVTLAYVLILWAVVPSRLSAFPIVDAASWKGILAHVVFLQAILGYPQLTAGIWYVCIDYQFCLLFASLLLIHHGLARLLRARSRRFDSALLLTVSMPWAAMSLFVWNRDPANDIWVSYYLGSLYLGVLCGWVFAGWVSQAAFWIFATMVAAALAVAWRERLVLSLATALVIFFLGRNDWLGALAARTPLRPLARISYSLFLVHYPTIWAIESLGLPFWTRSAKLAVLGMCVAFVVSLVVATAMYLLVERPSLMASERLRHGGGVGPRDRSALAGAPDA